MHLRTPLLTLALILAGTADAAATFRIGNRNVVLETTQRNNRTYVDAAAFAQAFKVKVNLSTLHSRVVLNNRTYADVDVLAKAASVTLSRKGNVYVAAAPTRTVQGTTQLAGGAATFGQAYTVGKSSPINITLRRAEFTVARVNHGANSVVPTASEKLLVLHFTLHNPRQADFPIAMGTPGLPTFTVVDAVNTNHSASPILAKEGTTTPLQMALKPAQKVDVYTVIRVPAQGPVPKLIVDPRDGSGVLRYDLRGAVAPLATPMGNPADKGVSALMQVPVKTGQRLTLGVFDAEVRGVSSTTEPLLEALNGETLGADERYAIVTLALKNMSSVEQPLDTTYLSAEFRLPDGERLAYPHQFLLASRSAWASGMIQPGQEVLVRVPFRVPQAARGGVFAVTEQLGGNTTSRTYLVNLDVR